MADKLILMVDGQPEILDSNEQELARCSEGAFSFLKARTIAEARDFLSQKPDVVIMETVLPDGSGFDLMRDIRMTANAFIVVLSKSGKVEDEVEWLARGADEYITKPCPVQALYYRILVLLKRKPTRTGYTIIDLLATAPWHNANAKEPRITNVKLNFDCLQIERDNGSIIMADLDALAGAPGYEALWTDGLFLRPETDGDSVYWQRGPRFTMGDIIRMMSEKYEKYWPPETENKADDSPPTILLIDDDKSLLHLNQRMLIRHGYAVETAATLAEARERLAGKPPDLILLDGDLPDGNGIDFLRELHRTSQIPVIMTTGQKSTEFRNAALEVGCNDFISKPYITDHLIKRVEKVLEILAAPQ